MDPISAVIPTLGGEPLRRTIEQLNRGKLVPAEILVCVPAEHLRSLPELPFPNVKVVRTSCRGQVAQRAVGFERAAHPLVLQLDSDVLIHEDALQALADTLVELRRGNAVAPLYYDVATDRCIHALSAGLAGWLSSLYAYVVCGAPWGVKRMGVVTAIGVNYGVDGRYCGRAPFETQWVPGGCVLSFRDDLIMEDFFPYDGKAFCEDVIHSSLRAKQGVRHWVIPDARCLIDEPDFETDPKAVRARNAARRYAVRLSGGSLRRLTLYNAISLVNRAAIAARRGR